MWRIRLAILLFGAALLPNFSALGAGKAKPRAVCRKDSAALADDPTEGYLRLTRTLVDSGELKPDGLRDLLGDEGLANPVDFADTGSIRGGVFRTAIAQKLADAKFDSSRARDGLRSLAGLSTATAERRERVQDESHAIVSIVDEGELRGRQWPDAIDQHQLFFVNGAPQMLLPHGSQGLAALDLRKGTFRERWTGGAVRALQPLETTKGEHFAIYSNGRGFDLDRIDGKEIEEATRLLPFEWRRYRAMGKATSFTKDGETHLAAIGYDGKGMDNVRATLRWFKFGDGEDAQVHAVPLGTTSSLVSSVSVGTFGKRTLLAAARGEKDGTIRFFDAQTATLHWETAAPEAASPPHFFETGGEARVAVVGSDKVHLVDPIRKVALTPIAVKTGDSPREPIYVERAGKHLALIPRDTDIAVVDLDAGVELAPMATGAHEPVTPRYDEMGSRAYLTWVDGDSQRVVIANFDGRKVEHHLDHHVGRYHSLVVYRDGDSLRGLSLNPQGDPSRLTFVHGKKKK